MWNQLMITVGREFGSGGHEIADALARRFQLPIYEENMLKEIAEKMGADAGVLKNYDELPRKYFFTRTVKGFNNAPEASIARMQFRFLEEQAAAGKSFVVVGRCAEEVLASYANLITIFVLADTAFKKKRTMEHGDISGQEALTLMSRRDTQRKIYHNQYCKGKWGDARNYDITVNSARLGIGGTVDLLERYIRMRMEQ